MNRKFILIAILTVALIGVLVFFYGGHRVPSRQTPLQSLTTQNLSAIKNSFNAADGKIRVLLLLSPT